MDNVAKVLYLITARLKKPYFSFDILATIPFQVSGLLRIYPDKELIFVLEESRIATYCHSHCLGTGRSIRYKVQLPQRSFTPGDVIPMQVEVSSEDDGHVMDASTVASLSLKLVQHIVYRIRRHRHQASFEVCKTSLHPGKEMLGGNFLLFLAIPVHSYPTRLGGRCKLINLQYVLNVRDDKYKYKLLITRPA